MKFGKNKKMIIKSTFCYLLSLFCTTIIALLLLLVSSIILAKTTISESVSSFIVIATYAISAIVGSVIFYVLTRFKGVICGGAVGVGTCMLKLVINQFSINTFQLTTYGCILIVCIVAGIMTASIYSKDEIKY